MKIITAAQLAAIREANEKVKGTEHWYYYQMPCDLKRESGSGWFFIGYAIPFSVNDTPVKTFKGKQYIMASPLCRYTLTPNVLEFLNDLQEKEG